MWTNMIAKRWPALASILFFLVLWHLISSNYFEPAFFPTPVITLKAAWKLLVGGELFQHITESLRRIYIGFVIGSLLAIPIGLIMGSSRIAELSLDPFVQFFRFVPAIAWLTPMVLWFGIGETSKILIIIYTTIFIVIVNTIAGVKNISKNKMRAASCLGANDYQRFIYVTLPGSIPFILTGMRLAMGNSFATVVAAEMVAAKNGLGYLIFNSRLWMATDDIFVGIIFLGGLGLLTDLFFRFAIQRFAHNYQHTN
ncbi:MAG TPA: ABC transporter permease [Candidatus Woesebacteria bacterium]|nr:ABC transporter permease [Candidatus Woesebacteria bacterium]